MRDKTRDLLTRYGLAILILALIFQVPKFPLVGQVPGTPIILFVLAIVTAAWYGGLGPGLLVTGLIVAITWTPLNQPYRVIRLALFVAMGLWISLLIERLHAARRRVEAAGLMVRRNEAQLQAILDHSPTVVFAKDLQGRFLLVNRLWRELFGIRADEALGKTIDHFLPAQAAGPLHAHDRQVIRSAKPLQWEEEIPLADGPHTFLAVKFPLCDADGVPYALCGIATDITERKRTEAAIQEAREAAEAANRAKDRFLAMLSHELRTPLLPVLMEVSALLERDGADPELTASMEMIRRNITLEARLIDDLLDIVRIEHDKLHLRLETVNAHLLVRRALEICRADLKAAEVRPVLALDASRAVVRADPARLLQVFWNLFKNAVKFTPPGGTLTIRSCDVDCDRLMIEISDTGFGIDPETLRRIFDAFDQGDTPSAHRVGGLGLGLAISRAVIEAHGGRLTASSEGRGRGASFTIELATVDDPAVPDADGSDSPALPFSPPSAAPRLPAHRVLVVEDNDDSRLVMTRLLERRGYRVTSADCLAAALDAASADDHDLIICDLGLPDGSGLDLIRQLSARKTVRAIALSGYGSDGDIQASLDAGFLAHLTKPVDFQKLVEAIESVRLDDVTSPARG